METHEITGYLHGTPYACSLVVSEVKISMLHREYSISFEMPGSRGRCEKQGRTLYEALSRIRECIEPDGWLLGISACRFDAIAPEAYGELYVCVPNSKSASWLKVGAFQEADFFDVASLEQQNQYATFIRASGTGPDFHSRLWG